jgi:hypothetical protein
MNEERSQFVCEKFHLMSRQHVRCQGVARKRVDKMDLVDGVDLAEAADPFPATKSTGSTPRPLSLLSLRRPQPLRSDRQWLPSESSEV